jgi:hypothetical protein
VAVRRGVVDVPGGDRRQTPVGGEIRESVVVPAVEWIAVVDELDVDVVAPEQVHELVKL